MSNNLKIITGQIISETKLSKEIKIQLLNFIQKEATDSQIKCLLMDGKIVQLDEQAEEIVNDRFENHKLNESVVATAGIIYGVTLLASAWATYRMARGVINKKRAQCGTLAIGLKRKICLLKLNAEEAKKMADIMAKNMASCKDSKDPNKCIEKHKKAIAKFKEKYEKNMNKIKQYNLKKPSTTQKGLEKAKEKTPSVV